MCRLCLCFLLLISLKPVSAQAEEQGNAVPLPDTPESDMAVPGQPMTDTPLPDGTLFNALPPDGPGLEESPLQEIFPHFREQAMIVDINARIVDQNQTVTWNESHRKATIPGRPVGIKLVGTNVVVVVQFTPYLHRGGPQKILVAQGQIWMDIPNQGMRRHTSIQTIPLEYDEPIYFFPLGPLREDDAACIEVMLTLHPYEEDKNN